MAQITIDAIGEVGGATPSIDMTKAMDPFDYSTQQSALSMRSLEGALSHALGAPGGASADGSAGVEMPNTETGAVSKQKDMIVSNSSASGTGASTEDNGVSSLDKTAAKINEVYREMTTWSVAWGIAQRVQKDVNQLLHGQ
ncbi:hypothetical protein [Yoonia sp.]|jgi:hypothetical protein|uniref:hypothetical protein n=1 Tax=Yoonia sp. TaxID=2212373 RepID=UPI0025E26629|nr:hypothetical protein [Yoonia sp.]